LHGDDGALEFRKKRKRRLASLRGDTEKDLEIRLLVEEKGKVSPDPVPVSP